MVIFRYVPDSDNFDSVMFLEKDRHLRNNLLQGKPLVADWEQIRLDEYFVGRIGDFPSLYRSVPVFSNDARKATEHILKNNVEFLPVICFKKEYFIVNVLSICTCLDEEKSELKRNRVTGHVSKIYKYSFYGDKIVDEHLFRIPQTAGLEVFMSNKLRDVIQENNLNGLAFNQKLIVS